MVLVVLVVVFVVLVVVSVVLGAKNHPQDHQRTRKPDPLTLIWSFLIQQLGCSR